jgi:hypothetical protein
MILRIEIYEPLTEEQVRLIKGSLAEMGVKDITVERFPEPEDEEEDELTEPQDDDILTEDHRHFYQYHKLILTVPLDDDGEVEDWKPHMREYLEKEQFYPNIWWVSDHGNTHLISVEPDGKYFAL